MTLTWNGAEPHQERWITGATAAFALLSVVVLHLVGAYDRAHPESLIDGARRGAVLQVTFNDDACKELALGEVVCGHRYFARYFNKNWTARGLTTAHPTRESIATFPDLYPRPGSISIWGIAGTFDSTGKLTVQGSEAGTVQFATGWPPL
jgi:hypothetical protein